MRRLILALVLVAAVSATGVALGQGERVGPDTKLQGNGRKLDPVGKLTGLGNFPAGAR